MRRSSKRNAADRALADEINAALTLFDEDDDLWAGVLAAAGSVFSAGSDLASGGDYFTERGGGYGIIRRNRTKPLIAAPDGPALGGGFKIVLACDLVVASDAAVFGLPEVARGPVPTCAGCSARHAAAESRARTDSHPRVRLRIARLRGRFRQRPRPRW
ncbi:enoyl-CoA hydratase-related protein [Rhodococcus sp. NPDC003382]|uniref:enoyl-CoA hydratase-related protein n=1 Tax=Rhodococcus sp. HM1 TaxID=2937759 RepID=UPI00200A64DB|nr:enoyl-CoA hydratase-related protein [Rhodococcus sp. HM1]MCK8669809.1 enoyl-CoA hydratase-related protein [Rhodococcus sp. HM1]